MTSATERLREQLKAKGIEHEVISDGVTRVYLDDRIVTFYNVGDALSAEAYYPRPQLNGTVWLTPEQAIAATLGDHEAVDFCKRVERAVSNREPLELFGVEYAALGAGECEEPEHDGRYECPDCGCVVYYDLLADGSWTIYVEDYQIPFNNCPKCGKAVKR